MSEGFTIAEHGHLAGLACELAAAWVDAHIAGPGSKCDIERKARAWMYEQIGRAYGHAHSGRVAVDVHGLCVSFRAQDGSHLCEYRTRPGTTHPWGCGLYAGRNNAGAALGVSDRGLDVIAGLCDMLVSEAQKNAQRERPERVLDAYRRGYESGREAGWRDSHAGAAHLIRDEETNLPVTARTYEGSVPYAIRELPDVRFHLEHDYGYVYFLCDERGEVVYVGQTMHIDARIRAHKKTKRWARTYYIVVREANLRAVEDAWIRRLKPRLNRTHGCDSADTAQTSEEGAA